MITITEGLFKYWNKISDLMKGLITPPLLLCVYVIVFVPLSLMMKIFKRDPLRLGKKWTRESNWIQQQDVSSFRDQF